MTDEEWNNDPRTKTLLGEIEQLELAQHVLSVTVVSAAKVREKIERDMQCIAGWLDDITGLDELPRPLMDEGVLPEQPAKPRRRASSRAKVAS